MSSSERWLFAALVVLACVIVSRGANAMRGDAPHYLAVSDSLLADRDLDLTNQYQPGTFRFAPDTPGSLLMPGEDGGVHLLPDAVGFAVALVPAYVAAGAAASAAGDDLLARLRWDETRAARDLMSFAMALLYAWTAVLAYRLTRRVRGASSGGLPAVVVAFATPPLLSMSFVVLPDTLAACLVVVFALAMTDEPPARARAALALACLPWLGIAYAAVAATGLVWWWGVRRTGNLSRITRAAGALPAVSLALMLALRWGIFGQLLPGWSGLEVMTGLTTVRGAVGLLLDRDVGLLVLAPYWALAIAGGVTLWGQRRGYVTFASAAFLGVWLAAALREEWWGGESPPGRPLIAVLPLLVPMVAEAFAALGRGWGRGLREVSIGWAGVMALALVIAPARMWPGSPKVLGLLSMSVLGMEADDVRPAEPAPPEAELAVLDLVGQDDARVVARYLDAGGDVNVRTLTGRTPLLGAVQGGHVDVVDLLIGAGADVNAADGAGWTPLLVAVRRERPDIARRLIAAGADVNAPSGLGWSPLVWAAYQGSGELVGLLLAAGADVDFTSQPAGSPLMRAAGNGHLDVVRLLVRAGADVDASVDGRRAVEWAALNGRAAVAAELTP